MDLKPLTEVLTWFLRWIVGNVERPASTVKPVTPIDIGFVERFKDPPYNLPQLILPNEVVNPDCPVEWKPTWLEKLCTDVLLSVCTSQTISPRDPLVEIVLTM